MAIIKKSTIEHYIEGYSTRAEGAAILIVSHGEIVAMFEMQINKITVIKDITPISMGHVNKVTAGWGSDLEKLDQVDFQNLVYNVFRVIV